MDEPYWLSIAATNDGATYEASRHIKTTRPWSLVQLTGRVNAHQLWDWAPGCVLCTRVAIEPTPDEHVWKLDFAFAVEPSGWDRGLYEPGHLDQLVRA